MAEEKSSGFFFDVAKWRGSVAVKRMSFSERGVYLEMLCEQWEKRNLPDDADEVSDRIALTNEQRAEILAAWPAVRRKFVTPESGPKRIYNAALERTRRKQNLNRRKRQEAGQRGGNRAAANRRDRLELQASNATADYSTPVAKGSDLTRPDVTRQDLNRPDIQIAKKPRTREADQLFEQFWKAYPKKKSKEDALKAWEKRRPDVALLGLMLTAIQVQAKSEDWRKEHGRYVPLPATWLNGARWTDVVDVDIGGTPRVDPFEWHCRHETPCSNRSTCAFLDEKARLKAG